MKVALILLCLALYLDEIQAQIFCLGRPRIQSCVGPMNEGHRRSPQCRRHVNGQLWYYSLNGNECRPMRYYGCGGNRNRYCSKENCEINCRMGGF